MISILGTWIYIGLTTLSLGFGIKLLLTKIVGYSIKSMDGVIFAGLISTTVYAQVFSFIGPVGLWANVVLIIGCLVVFLLTYKDMAVYLGDVWRRNGRVTKVIVFFLVMIWAFLTSRGYIMYDTDLYHAQSIRWLEEYGIVKGLGNLHERFAYNSSFFPLSALYSMKFLVGQSLHTVNGFFALLLSAVCIPVGKGFFKRKLCWSDFTRIAAIYYLTLIADEITGPTSDYCIMSVILYIAIKWVDEIERKQREIAPFALLSVVGVYALTLKLTAGLILLLVLKPAVCLIREKKWKEIGIYLGSGLMIGVPWVLRTVVISGYLLYPFSKLDLFSFDWKMRAERVEADASCIKAWGRGFQNVNALQLKLTEWFPVWLTGLSLMEKILISAALATFAILIALVLYILIKRRWDMLDEIHMMVSIGACYLFWQLSAPLVRYGYAYILLLDALVYGYFICRIQKDGIIRYAILAYGGYKALVIGSLIMSESSLPYYVVQQDYQEYKVQKVLFDSEYVYVAENGDRTGYSQFPSIPKIYDVELRGEGFQDGFRPAASLDSE